MTEPRPIPWSRMVAYSLFGVGNILNPPALRGFVMVSMKAGEQAIVLFPVSMN